MKYQTEGTCSTSVTFEVEDGIITSCEFERGCPGNTLGLSKMVIGTQIEDTIKNLSGIECRNGTSCPDQLAKALQIYLKTNNKKETAC